MFECRPARHPPPHAPAPEAALESGPARESRRHRRQAAHTLVVNELLYYFLTRRARRWMNELTSRASLSSRL